MEPGSASGAARSGVRLLATLRRLRWRQWAYRPLRRLQARLPAPGAPAAEPVDAPRAVRMAAALLALGPGGPGDPLACAGEIAAGRFTFVGHTECMDGVDWLARPVSPLWTYNLHYFDFAPHLARAFRATGEARWAEAFQRLAGGWIRETAGGRGPGWEAYPTSLRIVNWAEARLLLGDALDPSFRAELDASLHAQAAFLERRLEWHVLANHLQKNLYALVVAGLLFDGPHARRWLRRGLPLLWRELDEQVLDDGGHFERSPMYHAVALGDFLRTLALLDACGVAVPPEARERVGWMARAWTRLSRPTGEPHLFNDAAEGIAPGGDALARMAAAALGAAPERAAGAWSLPETGFFGWEGGADGDRLIVDCGAPGPGYQPGHVHCDALSLELDLGGARVVADSGTSGYEGDPLRAYQRSTRAHSTVQVGAEEQSEVWGTFRVGRMATTRVRQASAEGGTEFRFEGECRPWHDRRCAHVRRIEREGPGRWRVEDRVEGAAGTPLRSYLHLHPDWTVELRDDVAEAVGPAGARVEVRAFGGDRLRVARGETGPALGWYAARFGEAVPAPVLVLEVDGNDGRRFGFALRRVQ